MLVDSIENAFVPLLVRNNQPGKDKVLLKHFEEPAWNYQVIRFLDSRGRDLIPRKDRVWTMGPLAGRMIAALRKARRPVPDYLVALADEHRSPSSTSVLAFAMHCFWIGEMKLGRIDGVLSTEAGWLDGREVTRVVFDSKRLSASALKRQARKNQCADQVYSDLDGYRKAKESDQKRQIRGTRVEGLDLSPVQATKVNAWIREDPQKAMGWLSPRQIELAIKSK